MRNVRLALLIAAALTLAACGLTPEQRDAVGGFSSATSAIGSVSATQFIQMRQEIIQMNTEYLVLGRTAPTAKFALDRPLRTEAVTQRVLAVNALQSYGDTLNKLVTADESSNIKKAATDLVSNFNAVAAEGLTTNQQSAGIDLITSLGVLFVEHQKKQAIQRIVSEYACPVDQLAALLERDFLNVGSEVNNQQPTPSSKDAIVGCRVTATGDQAVGVLYGYELSAGQLKNAAIGVLADSAAGPERRREAIRAYVLADANAGNGIKLGAAGSKAVQALRKANADLAAGLQSDRLTVADAKEYAATVKQLIATVKVLTK